MAKMVVIMSGYVIILIHMSALYHVCLGAENIALGKPATQTEDLDYSDFLWTADRAVDGCGPVQIASIFGGDYEASQCCSSSCCGLGEQTWQVDLGQDYLIDYVVVAGRSDIDSQSSGFKLFVQRDGYPQLEIYDNSISGDDVTTPTTIPVNLLGRTVIITRPTGPLTLCEVEVYPVDIATQPPPTTTTTTLATTNLPVSTQLPQVSIALGKPTEQLLDLEYIWTWSSDKAVDGCYLRDDPNNFGDQCCAASMGSVGNYWKVYLLQQYVVDRIVLYSRGDGQDHLSGFQVYGQTDISSPEFLIYSDPNPGFFGDGIYDIMIMPTAVTALTIRRDDIITLCEVDVFGDVAASPTTTTTVATTTESLTTPQTGTSENIALGKPATQTENLDYSDFLWTADRAVDGCGPVQIASIFGGDYDASQCCSSSCCGVGEQTWQVDLGQDYLIDYVVVAGRSDIDSQLAGFKVLVQRDGFPSLEIYDHSFSGDDATTPTTIPVNLLGRTVIVTRPNSPLTICEVEVYSASAASTVAPTIPTTAPPTTSTTDVLTTPGTQMSIALGKPTEQLLDLEYIWTWSSDKAVDGCYLRDDPNNFGDQCCAASMGSVGNYWKVYLLQQYVVDRIVLYGRGDGQDNLSGFQVYGQTDISSPEFLIYSDPNPGFYGDGVYDIMIMPTAVTALTIRRDDIITLCEADVFGEQFVDTTTEVVTTPPPTQPPTTPTADVSIALGKPAEQLEDLNYIWLWSADKAVDGCYLRDNPNDVTAQCCATSMGLFGNYWRVNLQGQYLVNRVFIYSRGDGQDQISGFQIFGQTLDGWPEFLIYTDNSAFYGDGVFEIVITPVLTSTITIKRNDIITLCEVDVFGDLVSGETSTSSPETPTPTQPVTVPTVDNTTPTSAGPTIPTGDSYPRNVALGQPVSHLSSLVYNGFTWLAEYAVDGCNNGTLPDISRCCSSSEPIMGNTNFWRVDFPQQYSIMNLKVYGRSDFETQLEGFEIYVDQVPGVPVYSNLGVEYNDGIFDIILEPEVVANSFIIQRPNGGYIAICEFEAYEACPDGLYGVACTSQCGNCLAGEPCYKTTGTCPQGCDPGWSGTLCQTECQDGSYGYNCNETCGNCRFGGSCQKDTGTCTFGCDLGFQPLLCKTECTPGTYGSDCAEACGQCEYGVACNVYTGNCPGNCEAGWGGTGCKQECSTGTHGVNCAEVCGECLNGVACDAVTGTCSTGCDAGYQPPMCVQLCEAGQHGTNCAEMCGQCAGGVSCNIYSGNCPAGCLPGWTGPDCKQGCADGTYGAGCTETCGNCLAGMPCLADGGTCTAGCIAGYQPPMCADACPDGSYGLNCAETCGSCLGGSVCDKGNGQCATGCAAGYQPPLCQDTCPPGYYGFNCLLECGLCLEGTTCAADTGQCPLGCEPGWVGTNCDTEAPTTSTARTSTETSHAPSTPSIKPTTSSPPPSSSTTGMPTTSPSTEAPIVTNPTQSPTNPTTGLSTDGTSAQWPSDQPTGEPSTPTTTKGETNTPTRPPVTQSSTLNPTPTPTPSPTNGPTTAHSTQADTIDSSTTHAQSTPHRPTDPLSTPIGQPTTQSGETSTHHEVTSTPSVGMTTTGPQMTTPDGVSNPPTSTEPEDEVPDNGVWCGVQVNLVLVGLASLLAQTARLFY